MIFAEIPIRDALGAILAHSIFLTSGKIEKGRVLTRTDIDKLKQGRIKTVTVARLEPGDVDENQAAATVTEMLMADHIVAGTATAGRCNLIAGIDGLVEIDPDIIRRINNVDEAVTIATLPAHVVVNSGQIIATVKIIPFAVPDRILKQCRAAAAAGGGIKLHPWKQHKVGLIQTTSPALKPSLLEKTATVLNRRLLKLGCGPVLEKRCAHDLKALSRAITTLGKGGADLILIMGATATSDRHDLVPRALSDAGGAVDHLGMPVDPGNLLMLGHLGQSIIVGLPGCARSPAENGVDWVLQRIIAGLPMNGEIIRNMGVGGLLLGQRADIAAPVEKTGAEPSVAMIVLAAGHSARMGVNKLLLPVAGRPLIAHTMDNLTQSLAAPIIAVVGKESAKLKSALDKYDLVFAENKAPEKGISHSIKIGLDALPIDADAFMICLGDMPAISASVIDRIIQAYDPAQNKLIIVPTFKGKRGNPILWDRRFKPVLDTLEGDSGARKLLGQYETMIQEVAVDDDSILLDIDTPTAFEAYLHRLGGKPARRKTKKSEDEEDFPSPRGSRRIGMRVRR